MTVLLKLQYEDKRCEDDHTDRGEGGSQAEGAHGDGDREWWEEQANSHQAALVNGGVEVAEGGGRTAGRLQTH